jgi:hypothetical protein
MQIMVLRQAFAPESEALKAFLEEGTPEEVRAALQQEAFA